MKWISKLLTEALAAAQSTSLVVDPRLYITGASAPSLQLSETDSDKGSISVDSPATEKDSKLGLPAYSALRVTHGRPSIRKMLHEEIAASSGPVSVDGTSLIMST